MKLITGIVQMFIVYLMVYVCNGDKYSEQAESEIQFVTDTDVEQLENPFRIQKINVLWEDVKKSLPRAVLVDLYADLVTQDQHEVDLKKLKSEMTEIDVDMEAKVQNNFESILEKYGLDNRFFQDDDYFDNEIHHKAVEKNNIQFQDPKLQGLWRKVEQAGFSEEDLNMLKQEFWHQQMKINEYKFTYKEKDGIADPHDNSIEFEQKKLGLSPNEAKERKTSMKKDEKEIKEGYLRLEHLVFTHHGAEPSFKDNRVRTLWAKAKKTNWENDELNEFKEELLHFEHRLGKQTYYQKQLELFAEEELKEGDELWEEHQLLEEESKHLDQKIQKIHSDIKERLDAALRHTEL